MWNLELTVWYFDFPTRENNPGNSFASDFFIAHGSFYVVYLYVQTGLFLKLLSPIGQKDHVQEWFKIRLLLPWFSLFEFSNHYNELAFLRFLKFRLYRSKMTSIRVVFSPSIVIAHNLKIFPLRVTYWLLYNHYQNRGANENHISNCYRHILQCNRPCVNTFYRCNVIIIWLVVIRVKLFIIVDIINFLILKVCVLFCRCSSFYIFNEIILTRISCNI